MFLVLYICVKSRTPLCDNTCWYNHMRSYIESSMTSKCSWKVGWFCETSRGTLCKLNSLVMIMRLCVNVSFSRLLSVWPVAKCRHCYQPQLKPQVHKNQVQSHHGGREGRRKNNRSRRRNVQLLSTTCWWLDTKWTLLPEPLPSNSITVPYKTQSELKCECTVIPCAITVLEYCFCLPRTSWFLNTVKININTLTGLWTVQQLARLFYLLLTMKGNICKLPY